MSHANSVKDCDNEIRHSVLPAPVVSAGEMQMHLVQLSNSGRFLAGLSRLFSEPLSSMSKKGALLVTTVGSLHILWLKHKEYICTIYIYTPQKI